MKGIWIHKAFFHAAGAVLCIAALAVSVLLAGCAGPSTITVTGVRPLVSETDLLSVEAEAGSSPSEPSGQDTGDARIAVYVCGAVRNAGVYELPAGARVVDALDAAGGFSADADTRYLNQARTLADGEMLDVCTAQETARMKEQGILQQDTSREGAASAAAGTAGQDPSSSSDAPVNLNTASKEQLMTLPGIGEAKADAIIRYRTETGYFASTEDVMNISGIKNSIYEKIRDRITV